MRIIAIRHAETQWNIERILQGRLDSPVTENGFRQINSLLSAIKDFPISKVISSSSGRACTTGQVLADYFGCGMEINENLCEQNFGILEGLPFEQADYHYPDITSRLFAGDPTVTIPEGESTIEVAQRAISYIQSLATNNSNDTVCLVTHGRTLQYLLWQLKGGNLQEKTTLYSHQNCSYSVIEVKNERIHVVRWGVATHLLK
ncbi:histidine phosphatase family protein [Xenorhabdus sp. KK7.4]|uniref:histidine phosphatase family protein n=1 Tax=Xenorhabdus sp. KK7.4 TaxID=1851572 RepID=UPI000C04393D|nr:histidine phosphatase family protein [Xenorhabdus sp. KK7.4]PHM54503.1 phosphoglycerate mutase [Xenorhabdus sp. KK7.4]